VLRSIFLILFGFTALAGMSFPALAQSLEAALAHAYRANPDLNAARANTRGVDQGVPTAASGLRPRISASGDIGRSSIDGKTGDARFNNDLTPGGFGLSVTQPLFDGFKTGNSVGAAESAVLGARENLRNTEQNTILDAVTAYMNVLRDTALYSLRENNVGVLSEQVRQTRDRFNVGEVTRTDVAQSESRLAGAKADLAVSQSNLKASIARFRQVIGLEPKRLNPVPPVGAARLPKSQGDAVNRALKEHPAIAAALHGVDAQLLAVKVVESEFYPTIGVTGTLARRYDTNSPGDLRSSASVVGSLSVPIYDGGSASSRTRAAKETLGEKRLLVDSARDKVVAAAIAAHAAMDASRYQIEGASAAVAASEIALAGVREEAKVGQRTTLDVLNAQQELLNARVTLVTAQRDRVVASYNLLSATGQLSARSLGLAVAGYDPRVHYEQVKDSWYGLRTPSGE